MTVVELSMPRNLLDAMEREGGTLEQPGDDHEDDDRDLHHDSDQLELGRARDPETDQARQQEHSKCSTQTATRSTRPLAAALLLVSPGSGRAPAARTRSDV